MKKKILKTITLGKNDDPHISICPGHVDPKTFAYAHQAEGWDTGGRITRSDYPHKDDLRYEYWAKTKRGYKKVYPYSKGAKLFTVQDW